MTREGCCLWDPSKDFHPCWLFRSYFLWDILTCWSRRTLGIFATETDIFGKEQQWDILKAPTNPRAVLPWDCTAGRFPLLPLKAEPSCLGSPPPGWPQTPGQGTNRLLCSLLLLQCSEPSQEISLPLGIPPCLLPVCTTLLPADF